MPTRMLGADRAYASDSGLTSGSASAGARTDSRRIPMGAWRETQGRVGAKPARLTLRASEMRDGCEEGADMGSTEIVRRFYEGVAQGDVPTLLGLLYPKVHWTDAQGCLTGGAPAGS